MEIIIPIQSKKLLDTLDNIIEKNDIQFAEHNVEETKQGDNISIKLNIFEGEIISRENKHNR